MKKFPKIMLITLGFGLVTALIGFLTSRPATAQQPEGDEHSGMIHPHVVPVNVTNTPLPVTGTVNATVTGTVNASQSGSWNVGVNNLPAVQNVSFNGTAQPVSFSNTATTPVFNRDVDNGKNPFVEVMDLDNRTPPGINCSAITQCTATFPTPIPVGKRFVVEHVSAIVQGSTGQQYLVSLNGNTNDYFVLHLQASIPGLDSFTANHEMRVYIEQGRVPPPNVSVNSTNGTSFFAHVSISGYLVDVP